MEDTPEPLKQLRRWRGVEGVVAVKSLEWLPDDIVQDKPGKPDYIFPNHAKAQHKIPVAPPRFGQKKIELPGLLSVGDHSNDAMYRMDWECGR